MTKPTPKSRTAIDFLEAQRWVTHVLGYDVRRVPGAEGAEFRGDFWVWLVDRNDIKRGTYTHLAREVDTIPEWAVPVYNAFYEEFKEYADGRGVVTFFVDW